MDDREREVRREDRRWLGLWTVIALTILLEIGVGALVLVLVLR